MVQAVVARNFRRVSIRPLDSLFLDLQYLRFSVERRSRWQPIAAIPRIKRQTGSYSGTGFSLEGVTLDQLSQETARKSDFFPKWEIEIGEAAHKPF